MFRTLQIQMLELISKYSSLLKNTKHVVDNKHFHATTIDHKDNYMILIFALNLLLKKIDYRYFFVSK